MNVASELMMLIAAGGLLGTALVFWSRRRKAGDADGGAPPPRPRPDSAAGGGHATLPTPAVGHWGRGGNAGEIAGFRIEGRIKEGGTADVLKARAPQGGAFVIKLLKGAQMANPEAKEQFLRECQVLRAIDLKTNSIVVRAESDIRQNVLGSRLPTGPAAAPSVPLGHGTLRPVPGQAQGGFWPGEGRLYLVMEYLDGEAMDDVLAQRAGARLSNGDILAVARDVALALHLTHEAGFCHMDVKPGNILVWRDRDGRIARAKLIDFGAALPIQTPQARIRMVTPNHAAPELWTQGYSPRTDLYALGVTLWEMAAGRMLGETETNPPVVPADWDPVLQRVLGAAGLPLERGRVAACETAEEFYRELPRLMSGPAADAALEVIRVVFAAGRRAPAAPPAPGAAPEFPGAPVAAPTREGR